MSIYQDITNANAKVSAAKTEIAKIDKMTQSKEVYFRNNNESVKIPDELRGVFTILLRDAYDKKRLSGLEAMQKAVNEFDIESEA